VKVLDEALKDGTLAREASYEMLAELVPLLPVLLSESLHSDDNMFDRCFGVKSPLLSIISRISSHFLLPLSLLPSFLRSPKLWRPLSTVDGDRALSLPARDYFYLTMVLLRVLPENQLTWSSYTKTPPQSGNTKPLFSGFLPAGTFPMFASSCPPTAGVVTVYCAYDRIVKEHMEISSSNFRLLLDWIVLTWLNPESDVFGTFSKPGIFESLISMSTIVHARTPEISKDTRNFFTREISMLYAVVGEEQSLMAESMLIGNLNLWKFLFAKLPKFKEDLLEVFIATMSRAENFEISDQLAEAMVDAYKLLVSLASKDVAKEVIKTTENCFALLYVSPNATSQIAHICELLSVLPPRPIRGPLPGKPRAALPSGGVKRPPPSQFVDERSVWKRPPRTSEFAGMLPLLFVVAKMIDKLLNRRSATADDAVTQIPRLLARWSVISTFAFIAFLFTEDVVVRGVWMLVALATFVRCTFG
jgi:hypothetical protein